jgi:hypothetical protein
MKRQREGTSDEDADVNAFEVVGKGDDWALVEEGELKGIKIGTDLKSGVVVSLSSRQCREVNRWLVMPSIEQYGSLKELDLHKSRYIRELHDSICGLASLKTLLLTRCEKLTTLPKEIGLLQNLREVRSRDINGLAWCDAWLDGLRIGDSSHW